MNAMRVLLVPARLRLAAALLFLCVPLAAFETVVVTRAPWWRLPYSAIGLWSSVALLLVLPLSAWLLRGRAWVGGAAQAFFITWLLLGAWVAVRTRNPGLGFLTVLQLALFGAWLTWIRHELGRSFFDPRMRWYQGLPRPLPGIACHVAWSDRELDCRVSRLDREGAFVFAPPPAADADAAARAALVALRTDVRSELTFRFRERVIHCSGRPVRALAGDRGAGFQFDGLEPDSRKQLGDFIELLKGEGYVL